LGATASSTTEELLVGLNSICGLSELLQAFGEEITLLIDLLVSNVLLVLSEVAQDAGVYSSVAGIACVLCGMMSSSA
jgi:hypothetical protein